MNIQPKKSLGQNFLRDEKVLQKIIQSANLNSDDFIIEVGPGEGVLTEELAKRVKKVLAIEIDERLAVLLKNKFENQKNIEIISGDILKINLPEMIRKYITAVETPRRGVSTGNAGSINYKLIANIPYYITSAIIRLFLECKYPPTEMILMVQKEVAKRICAKPGAMSILAVSVQYYATPELLFYVDKKSFFPVPEVDSAVIKIEVRRKKNEESHAESKKFFRIVKAGFSAKRKTLVNNLATSLQLDKNIVEEKIRTVGLKPTVRAQELSVEDWKKLEHIMLSSDTSSQF